MITDDQLNQVAIYFGVAMFSLMVLYQMISVTFKNEK